jgi:hypothetical protein
MKTRCFFNSKPADEPDDIRVLRGVDKAIFAVSKRNKMRMARSRNRFVGFLRLRGRQNRKFEIIGDGGLHCIGEENHAPGVKVKEQVAYYCGRFLVVMLDEVIV